MNKKPRRHEAIAGQMRRFEAMEGLRHALDDIYRRLRASARRDWEQLFAGKDPSDTCVSVRISAIGVRGSAFLPKPKSVAHGKRSKLPYPSLAH